MVCGKKYQNFTISIALKISYMTGPDSAMCIQLYSTTPYLIQRDTLWYDLLLKQNSNTLFSAHIYDAHYLCYIIE